MTKHSVVKKNTLLKRINSRKIYWDIIHSMGTKKIKIIIDTNTEMRKYREKTQTFKPITIYNLI